MLRLIRYGRAILLVLAVPVGLLVLYDFLVARKGGGGLRYDVRVVSSVPVQEVRYESFGSRGWAEESVQFKSVDRREIVRPEEWEDDLFSAWVTIHTGESGLYWRASYVQYRYLAVVAVLADGRRVAKVVKLPDANESREVTVRLD